MRGQHEFFTIREIVFDLFTDGPLFMRHGYRYCTLHATLSSPRGFEEESLTSHFGAMPEGLWCSCGNANMCLVLRGGSSRRLQQPSLCWFCSCCANFFQTCTAERLSGMVVKIDQSNGAIFHVGRISPF